MESTRFADAAIAEPSFAMLTVLRALGVGAAITSSVAAAVMVAQSSWEFLAGLLVLGLLWAVYLCWGWNRARGLLLCVPLVLCSLVFGLFAENLLTFERLFKFRISNKLDLSARLIRWASAHVVYRTNTWQQFGDDPLFFRREPGSVHRDRYDYRNYGREYEAVVDTAGFLNGDRTFYDRHSTIDMFLAGASVIEGVGMPGVVEELNATLPVSVFSLATGSYSPRQKADALRIFGIPKHPKWLVAEFHGGTDASAIIEDDICRALVRNYECRFDFPFIASALSRDARYASLGAFGDFTSLIQRVREVRADSMTLALGTGVALYLRRFVQESPFSHRVLRLQGEAISMPGAAHFQIYPERHLEWVRQGLTLTLRAYDDLGEAGRRGGAEVIVLYNPTSYEIYRDVLPIQDTNPLSDGISALQRELLARYTADRGLGLCDLTEAFRRQVGEGRRGLFGRYDGTHWSPAGRMVAAGILAECLGRFLPKVTEPIGARPEWRGRARP